MTDPGDRPRYPPVLRKVGQVLLAAVFLTMAALFVWRVAVGNGGAAIVLFRACVFAWFAMLVFGRRVLSLRYNAALDTMPQARAFAVRTRRIALAGSVLFVLGMLVVRIAVTMHPAPFSGPANLVPAAGGVTALLGLALIAFWLMGRMRVLALVMNANAAGSADTLARQTRMQFLLMLGRIAISALIIYVAVTLYPDIKSNVTSLAVLLIFTLVLFQLSMRTYTRRASMAGSPWAKAVPPAPTKLMWLRDGLVVAAVAWIEIALSVFGIDTPGKLAWTYAGAGVFLLLAVAVKIYDATTAKRAQG